MGHHGCESDYDDSVICAHCKTSVPRDNYGRMNGLDIDLHGVCLEEGGYKKKHDAKLPKPKETYDYGDVGRLVIVGVASAAFSNQRVVVYRSKGKLGWMEENLWVSKRNANKIKPVRKGSSCSTVRA